MKKITVVIFRSGGHLIGVRIFFSFIAGRKLREKYPPCGHYMPRYSCCHVCRQGEYTIL